MPDYVSSIPVDPTGISYKIGIVEGRVRVRASGSELGATIAVSGSGGSVVSNTTPSDPYWNNVSLLLDFDGANGSTTFTDRSPTPKTVTAVGDAKISTVQSKFGGTALYLDGSSDRITIPGGDFNFGTGDYTVEMWIYPIAVINNYGFLWSPTGGSNQSGVEYFYISNTNRLGFQKFQGSRPESSINGIFFNQGWQHVAAVKSGGVMQVFLNGTPGTPLTVTASTVNSTTAVVGENLEEWGTNGRYHGYIDDIRITKGIARYTSNFIPPTESFPTQ